MKSFALTSSLAVALFAASLVDAKKCVHRPSHSPPSASNVPPVYTDFITSSAPMTYATATVGTSGQPSVPATTDIPSTVPSQPLYTTLPTANETTAYGTTSYSVQTSVATSAVSTRDTSVPPNYSTTIPTTTIIQNQTTLGCTNSSTCTDTTHYSSGFGVTTSTPIPSTTASTPFAYTTLSDSTPSSVELTSYSVPSMPPYYSPPPAPYTPTPGTNTETMLTTGNGGNQYSTFLAPPIPRPTIFTDTAQYY
ncbi:hypothetical protein IWW57_001949 [Coemansia sp. S610]|nr:hypothetical protein IWW57_001949 [Coemansia sp. S610]KAJ2403976.1 hypothetical protein GGI10_005620 [Coemansia sp. RSA 2530]